MKSETILKQVTSQNRELRKPFKRKSKVGLFSLLLLCTLLFGLYQWYTSLMKYLQNHPIQKIDHYQFAQIIQLDHTHSFQETILKFKPYLIFTCGYVQPNIIMLFCIFITFPLVINSIETQSATSITFFQFNGINIYMQIIRIGLDGVQYFLSGRCYCLNSGCSAAWINMMTKIVYYRMKEVKTNPLYIIPITITFIISGFMFVMKARVDLLVAVVIALIEIDLMGGGTIKYPKQVFQEKQNWAQSIQIDKLKLWHPFIWNHYKQNQYYCLDNSQLYIKRQDRILGNQIEQHSTVQ